MVSDIYVQTIFLEHLGIFTGQGEQGWSNGAETVSVVSGREGILEGKQEKQELREAQKTKVKGLGQNEGLMCARFTHQRVRS